MFRLVNHFFSFRWPPWNLANLFLDCSLTTDMSDSTHWHLCSAPELCIVITWCHETLLDDLDGKSLGLANPPVQWKFRYQIYQRPLSPLAPWDVSSKPCLMTPGGKNGMFLLR